MSAEQRALLIGDLARLAGVTTRTIRHHERLGLIARPPRRPNGYRSYDQSALLALLEIRRLQAAGLALSEIAELGFSNRNNRDDLVGRLEALRQQVSDEITALHGRRALLDRLKQAIESDEAILAVGTESLFEPIGQLLDAVDASPQAIAEARRLFAALEAVDLPDGWQTAVTEGLASIREDAAALSLWVEALDLVAQLRDVDDEDPLIAVAANRLAELANASPARADGWTVDGELGGPILIAIASCFTSAQVRAAALAASRSGWVHRERAR